MKRCAIYTRKSSEEGLDQQFNSLDAQREACEAYVLSQAGEGWIGLPERYDDGGFSGGTMERPALQRLLADSATGNVSGGQRISRGATFHLLRNRVYIGQIVHKGEAYPGLHERIVSQDLFDRVQAMLAEHRHERSAKRQTTAPLAGKLFLADGRRLTPTHSRGSNGTNYRYYMPVDSGPQTWAGTAAVRLPALRFEAHLRSILKRAVPDDRAPLGLLSRVEIHAHRLVLSLPLSMQSSVRAAACHEDEVERTGQEVHWMVPWTWPRRGCSQMGTGPSTSRRDPVLIKALRAAHAMLDHDRKGRPFLSKVPSGCYQRRLAPLAFLSPVLQAAIVDGRQPAGLTLEHLVRNPLPLSWDEQEQFLTKLAAR